MWKTHVVNAILLALIASALGIVMNQVRTPILNAAAESGLISKASSKRFAGVNLIDNWSHGGWPEGKRIELPSEPSDSVTTSTVEPEPHMEQYWVISLYSARKLFDEGDCIFLDARSPEEYAEEHIEGALNWPSDQFQAYFLSNVEKVPKEKCVVVYCSGGTCDESHHLALSLVAEGWQEVYLYEGGITEWAEMNYPTKEGNEP